MFTFLKCKFDSWKQDSLEKIALDYWSNKQETNLRLDAMRNVIDTVLLDISRLKPIEYKDLLTTIESMQNDIRGIYKQVQDIVEANEISVDYQNAMIALRDNIKKVFFI